MKKIKVASGKPCTCKDCGLIVITECQEYFCPYCKCLIVNENVVVKEIKKHES